MKPLPVAIIGFGRLGKACAERILTEEQLTLAGIVRRAERVMEPLPKPFQKIPSVAHPSELAKVDAALLCVPTEEVLGKAQELIQHGVPIVECATFHDEAFQHHQQAIERLALRHKVAAIVGAGWDPGVLSLLRALFMLLTPKGHTETTRRPGVSLHHTTVARAISGVKAALSTELHAQTGKGQRYVYIELEKGAELEKVKEAICTDPLFLNEETFVFPVDSVATLEQEDHGVLMERRGAAGYTEHQLLLFEARFSELALAAQVMVAAAQTLPLCNSGAYSLLDLPLGKLWGQLREQVKQEVI